MTMKLASLTTLIAGTLCASPVVLADFLKDSKATLDLRNMYFHNDVRDAAGKTAEWAQGAVLRYQSGFTDGAVGVGVDAIGLLGVRLDGGRGHHQGSSMIPSERDGSAVDDWSHAGATAKLRVSKTILRYGNSLQPALPILNTNDGRLLPQTYAGAMLTSNELDNVTFVAGQLEHMVGRASTNHSGFAVAAPSGQIAAQSNQFRFAGADWRVVPGLTLRYYYANMQDYYGQHFVGLQHTLPIGEDRSLSTDLRYFRTDSDGANSSAAGRARGYRTGGYTDDGTGEIDNRTWSAALTYRQGFHSLMVGHQQVSSGSNFVQPNQGGTGEEPGGYSNYLYTDRMIFNFTRAGERTNFAQYDYAFTPWGLPGLSASIAYLRGDQVKTTSGPSAKEWERDIALDYLVQSGPLKNVKFSWRNGSLRGNATTDQDQNRLIVSYSIPLL